MRCAPFSEGQAAHLYLSICSVRLCPVCSRLGLLWKPSRVSGVNPAAAPILEADFCQCLIRRVIRIRKATMHCAALSCSFGHRPHSWKALRTPPRLVYHRKPAHAQQEHQRRINVAASTQESDTRDGVEDSVAESDPPNALPQAQKSRRQADSTDWVSSQLTRRFGCVLAVSSTLKAGAMRGVCCSSWCISHAASPEDWSGSASWPLASSASRSRTRLEDSAERENTKVHHHSSAGRAYSSLTVALHHA